MRALAVSGRVELLRHQNILRSSFLLAAACLMGTLMSGRQMGPSAISARVKRAT